MTTPRSELAADIRDLVRAARRVQDELRCHELCWQGVPIAPMRFRTGCAHLEMYDELWVALAEFRDIE